MGSMFILLLGRPRLRLALLVRSNPKITLCYSRRRGLGSHGPGLPVVQQIHRWRLCLEGADHEGGCRGQGGRPSARFAGWILEAE